MAWRRQLKHTTASLSVFLVWAHQQWLLMIPANWWHKSKVIVSTISSFEMRLQSRSSLATDCEEERPFYGGSREASVEQDINFNWIMEMILAHVSRCAAKNGTIQAARCSSWCENNAPSGGENHLWFGIMLHAESFSISWAVNF